MCKKLSEKNHVIGIKNSNREHLNNSSIQYEVSDLTDTESLERICAEHVPDVIIHCAGIAYQELGSSHINDYRNVNILGSEKLATIATNINPDIDFIFLSSASVYDNLNGNEMSNGFRKLLSDKLRRNKTSGIKETSSCYPSSDYAKSKLDAEKRLRKLYSENELGQLYILRLAPVYDNNAIYNLTKRVLSPGDLSYLRFGLGLQKMSALSRDNLVEYIDYIISNITLGKARKSEEIRQTDKPENRNIIINVSDDQPYDFNKIISVLKMSGFYTNRPVISVPLRFVWFTTRVLGRVFPKKKKWVHSWYNKLAFDFIIDNTKMKDSGFLPAHTLESIFRK